jgi:hypothetical protein
MLLFFLHVEAQDSIRKLSISTLSNRIVNPVKQKNFPSAPQRQITQKIHHFLDSMVQTNDGHPDFVGKIKAGISNILYQFWNAGYLVGKKQEEAFFVQCGALTITQKDIDDGRLVLIAGFACVRPGEFETQRFERILLNKAPLQYARNY